MLLENREFRAITFTRFLFSMAMQAQAVVVGWMVYDLTKSPLYLGLIGLTEAIPAITFALLAGHLVDRGHPYVYFKNALLFCMLSSLSLTVISYWDPGIAQLPLIFGVIFLSGISRSFISPSMYTIVPHIVTRSLYMASSAWLTCFFQLAAIGGPAIAGFIYLWVGKTFVLALITGLVLLAGFQLTQLAPHTKKIRNKTSQDEPILASIRAGIHFVFSEKILLAALSLDMFSVLFGGAIAILPAFSDQVLQAGPSALGILRAAPAFGAIVVSIGMILLPQKAISGKVLLLAVAGFGLSTIAFGFTQTLAPAVFCLILTGAFDSVSMIIRGTLMQLYTPDQMRGRVSAVNSVFISSSNELGAFESGLAANFMGVVPSIIFGGSMTLFVVATVWLLTPKLVHARVQR